MAEKAVGGPNATDIFGLGGNYHPQTSSTTETENVAYAQGADGDVIATDTYGGMTEVSCPYTYNSSTPMFNTAEPTEQSLPLPGEIKNGYIVTSVAVSYSPTVRPTVTVTGHNHDENAHDADLATFSPTIDIPGGFGCPALLTNSDTASAPSSESYTISCEHVDVDDGSGDHLAGATYNGKETLSLEFVGTPVLTTTGWTQTSKASTDGSTAFDAQSLSLEKALTRDA